MLVQIGGGGDDEVAQLTEMAAQQGRVAQSAGADRDVDIVLYQVHRLVGQADAEAHAGVVGEEGRQQRQHVGGAETDGGADAQVSGRRYPGVGGDLLGLVYGINDLAAGLQVALAFLGQAPATG